MTKGDVVVAGMKLGAGSKTEIAACCGLPPDEVEACLHSLAAEGRFKAKATYMRRGKKIFAFVYWQPIEFEGSYYSIRQQQQEKWPEAFEKAHTRKRKPRVLIVDKVQRIIEEYPNNEFSVDDMRDWLGATYAKVLKAMKTLEQEGVVKKRKDVYGRGRPRMMWSAVNGKEPEPEKQVWSFDDDPEAVDLE